MSVVNVKITDLLPHITSKIAENDLLLKAAPLIEDQYVSHTCQVKSFINYIINGAPRTITDHWIFTVKAGTIPSVNTTRLEIDKYWHEILEDQNELNRFLNTFGEATRIDGYNISQYSIANVDYVNRLFGFVFKEIGDRIKSYYESAYTQSATHTQYIKSAVGDFVFSNTFAPKDSYNETSESENNNDAMLRYYYGHGQDLLSYDGTTVKKAPNTKWRMHGAVSAAKDKRYVLTGADSGVEFDKQEKTAGNDRYDFALPDHTHTVPSHSHSASLTATVDSGLWVTRINEGDSVAKQSHADTHSDHVCSKHGDQDGDIAVSVSIKATGTFKNTTPTVSYTGNLASNFSCFQPTTYFYIWERVA